MGVDVTKLKKILSYIDEERKGLFYLKEKSDSIIRDTAKIKRKSGILSREAPEYCVYATQFDTTIYEIALPDKYIKWDNLGQSGVPEEYQGLNVHADLTRDGYFVSDVIVSEVGPWNEDDNLLPTTLGSI